MAVSIGDLDQAEAQFAEQKADYNSDKLSKADYAEAKRQVVAVRHAYRNQEIAAGRRVDKVGGDAFPEEH